ncbi:hypothetical protein [Thermococcus stetteri]|uniref:hypothetical protein n=1 Tax=Thermococcus stetteri TaxID=49900 RepID=UPI001AEB948B|nr:hypothetical protein [Thermococcus stetteri]MBP1912269.1 archaellum component FlaC [Thermococcus stetteri]
MDYTTIIAAGIAIGASAFAVYYSHDTSEKIKNRLFELKKEVDSLGENFESLRKQLLEKINELERKSTTQQPPNEANYERISRLTERLSKLESLFKEKLKGLEKSNVQLEYELGSLKKRLDEVEKEVGEVAQSFTSSREEIKEELKRELLAEVEEEIERLEELIERRKEEGVEEFLDMLRTAVTMNPEKISSGLLEAKRALLSLRDIAKVYVLTGKGRDEFTALKENLLGLLKNLRKLVIVSVPEEEIYSKFRDIIIDVKRLDLTMKDEKSGKDLNPERSFIEIHKLIYKLAGEFDEIANKINEPVPVTPVEKEFYEKLRYQFEELSTI